MLEDFTLKSVARTSKLRYVCEMKAVFELFHHFFVLSQLEWVQVLVFEDEEEPVVPEIWPQGLTQQDCAMFEGNVQSFIFIYLFIFILCVFRVPLTVLSLV